MIKVWYVYGRNGRWYNDCRSFSQASKAIRFAYMMSKKGYIIHDFECDDRYIREYCLIKFDITNQ